MKLYQVRKGQFVYFNNELHKVYSVTPIFKQSVHLVRLKDLEQQLTQAKQVELYKPQPLDSFIFHHRRYTLHDNRRAKQGDYILVTNPKPDYLDHYSLHSIEEVSSVEDYGVITNRSNGIKHSEYWLMVPGREEGARLIDYQTTEGMDDEDLDEKENDPSSNQERPSIGDVYQKMGHDDDHVVAMIVAVQGKTIILGGGLELDDEELTDPEKWAFQYNMMDA